MLRLNSLRFRIASAYIVGALVVSGAVAGATYYITSWVLTRQAVQSAQERSYEELRFLRDRLSIDEGEGKLRSYLRTLQQRGSDVVAMVPEVRGAAVPPDTTSVGLSGNAIPAELRAAVERGRVGYAIIPGPTYRQIVFGSSVPGITTPVDTFFFYSLESVDRTLSLLRRVLLGVLAVAAAAAAAVGVRLADRTIRPLREAARAARMARWTRSGVAGMSM